MDNVEIVLVVALVVCVIVCIVYYTTQGNMMHSFCTENGFVGSRGDFCYRYTNGDLEKVEFGCDFEKCYWVKVLGDYDG